MGSEMCIRDRAFFGDTFVIWCILMAVSFVGAFLITILIGFKDIPEEEA